LGRATTWVRFVAVAVFVVLAKVAVRPALFFVDQTKAARPVPVPVPEAPAPTGCHPRQCPGG
jgi:uncharacterized membrane protein